MSQEETTSTGEPTEEPARQAPARRKIRPLAWAGRIVLFLVVALVASTVIGHFRAPALSGDAPDFALRDLDGREVRLSDFRGRTVVVNFWATWCGPCRVEMPSFARFARKNTDVAFLGLAVASPPEDLRAAVETYDLPYPVLPVDEATLDAYRVSTLPTTVVIDPEGRIRSSHSGILFGFQLAWLTR